LFFLFDARVKGLSRDIDVKWEFSLLSFKGSTDNDDVDDDVDDDGKSVDTLPHVFLFLTLLSS
jgi:hypothetical protein